MLKILLTAMIILFIMVPLELIVLGPIGSYAGTYIAKFMDWFYNFGGFVAAALLGGTRSLLTMMGMHYALGPLQIQQIAETGTSTLLVSALTANFAQGGAAFGACLKIKDKSMKSAAGSAALSAVLGITEPAMYGVNLKYKRPFVCAMISSAIGAAFLSFFHAGAIAYAPPGLFTVVTYTADNFIYIIIGITLSFLIATFLSFFFGIPSEANTDCQSKDNTLEPIDTATLKNTSDVHTVDSPIIGEVIPLSEVDDETFSSEIMGKGVAIIPHEGKIYAPFDGEVEMLFDTKHAIGLRSTDGISLLIHVGLDTVQLNGQYFNAHVNVGDQIKKGQVLLEFDLKQIEKKYPIVTPVIVGNTDEFKSVRGITGPIVDKETTIIEIKF